MSRVLLTRTRDRPENGCAASDTHIDLRPLLGGWVNYNERSTGITRVDISDWEGTAVIRVFGAGRPAPTDWGEVAGLMFAGSVGQQEAVAFRARYDLGFAYVLLTGYLNKRLLVIDAFSTFADGSGRANYFQRDHFYLP